MFYPNSVRINSSSFFFLDCHYGGKTYKAGTVFAKGDKCNRCTCMVTGSVVCTSDSCAPSKSYVLFYLVLELFNKTYDSNNFEYARPCNFAFVNRVNLAPVLFSPFSALSEMGGFKTVLFHSLF